MRNVFFISVSICLAASYAAYKIRTNYDPVTEARNERIFEGNHSRDLEENARSMAREAVQKQNLCIANHPLDRHECGNLSYQRHLQAMREISKDVDSVLGEHYIPSRVRESNFYIVIAAIAGFIAGLVAFVNFQQSRKSQSETRNENSLNGK